MNNLDEKNDLEERAGACCADSVADNCVVEAKKQSPTTGRAARVLTVFLHFGRLRLL